MGKQGLLALNNSPSSLSSLVNAVELSAAFFLNNVWELNGYFIFLFFYDGKDVI